MNKKSKTTAGGGYDHSKSPVAPYSAETTTGKPIRSSEFDSVRSVRQALTDRKGFRGITGSYMDTMALRKSRADRVNRQADKKLKARESH
jgi:hypothetical protein